MPSGHYLHKPRLTPMQRFCQKVILPEQWKDEACWEWVGAKHSAGYGAFQAICGRGGKTGYAHRYSYERFVGPIPEGLTIDHLCRNRRCVNPEHLEAVPHRTNTLRGTSPAARNAAKETCMRGHALSRRGSSDHRICKTCVNVQWRERYATDESFRESHKRRNATGFPTGIHAAKRQP